MIGQELISHVYFVYFCTRIKVTSGTEYKRLNYLFLHVYRN